MSSVPCYSCSVSYTHLWKINRFGDAVRWEEIDEDIHLSSFYDTEEPDADNVIGDVFRRFPQLNVSEVARTIGIQMCIRDSI